MSSADPAAEQTAAEDLFEHAPCGYLSTTLDGTILRANRTFSDWTGHDAEDLRGRRFQHLLSAGARIYYDTHFAPLLNMQGSVREIALDIVRADTSRFPALINADVRRDACGAAQSIRIAIFDATARRSYERQLLEAERRQHEIADELQRGLLAGVMPASAELQIGYSYRSAIPGVEIGGDWYDAFWHKDPDRVVLVVGDVVGRGITAGTEMGQLRSAIRAFSATDLSPGEVLESLDRYAQTHDVGQMATVVIGELDLSQRTFRYACAGHPPPVLCRDGAPPELLWEGRSVPLSAWALPRKRPEAQIELSADATILLYTDGLIERRDAPLTRGIDQLLEHTAAAARHEPAALAHWLVRALDDPDHADDVCLLVARLTHGPAPRSNRTDNQRDGDHPVDG